MPEKRPSTLPPPPSHSHGFLTANIRAAPAGPILNDDQRGAVQLRRPPQRCSTATSDGESRNSVTKAASLGNPRHLVVPRSRSIPAYQNGAAATGIGYNGLLRTSHIRSRHGSESRHCKTRDGLWPAKRKYVTGPPPGGRPALPKAPKESPSKRKRLPNDPRSAPNNRPESKRPPKRRSPKRRSPKRKRPPGSGPLAPDRHLEKHLVEATRRQQRAH